MSRQHSVKKPRDKAGQTKTHAPDDHRPRQRVEGGAAPGGLGLQGTREKLDNLPDERIDDMQLDREVKEQAGEMKGAHRKGA